MTEVQLALKMADEALRHNRWATLRVTDKIVKLEVGPIRPDGTREYKSATYTYYTDADGTPHFNVYSHP